MKYWNTVKEWILKINDSILDQFLCQDETTDKLAIFALFSKGYMRGTFIKITNGTVENYFLNCVIN